MNVAVIGAGAMGCIYGMYLSRKNDVLLVDVVQPHVDAINEKGLEFQHLDGEVEMVTRLKATTDTSGCARHVDSTATCATYCTYIYIHIRIYL